MKTIIKKALSALFICGVAQFSSAQTLHSLYFLEGNNQRHNLNPAFTNESNYISFPALGNLHISANSNVGLGTFLRPQGNEMITFMHGSVGVEDALSKFKDNNIIEADLGINILSAGFNSWGGSNTISLNIKSQTGVYIPKTVFTFLKLGQTDTDTQYDASDITARTQNYAELAFGHARQINEKISVGAKFKLLFGANYTNAHVDQMNIFMSDSEWRIRESSYLEATRGVEFESKPDGELESLKIGNFGLAGFGVGLDLGAVYKINENASVSVAVTDLGFISWNNVSRADNLNKEFKFTGFDNIGAEDDENGDNPFSDAADEVFNSLKGLVKFHDKGEKTSKTTSLYSTIRVGGEYGILCNKISFGLLGSMRVGAPKLWSEAMITANFRPATWFNAAINGSFSNVRSSMGATLNFHPKAVNIFIGMDYLLATYSKQFIPVDAAKLNLGLGISFNF